jgi:hypothetical protein
MMHDENPHVIDRRLGCPCIYRSTQHSISHRLAAQIKIDIAICNLRFAIRTAPIYSTFHYIHSYLQVDIRAYRISYTTRKKIKINPPDSPLSLLTTIIIITIIMIITITHPPVILR